MNPLRELFLIFHVFTLAYRRDIALLRWSTLTLPDSENDLERLLEPRKGTYLLEHVEMHTEPSHRRMVNVISNHRSQDSLQRRGPLNRMSSGYSIRDRSVSDSDSVASALPIESETVNEVSADAQKVPVRRLSIHP